MFPRNADCEAANKCIELIILGGDVVIREIEKLLQESGVRVGRGFVATCALQVIEATSTVEISPEAYGGPWECESEVREEILRKALDRCKPAYLRAVEASVKTDLESLERELVKEGLLDGDRDSSGDLSDRWVRLSRDFVKVQRRKDHE